MPEGDLFNEWLHRSIPGIRGVIPDAAFTAHYHDAEETYELVIESKGHYPIHLGVLRSATFFTVFKAVVVLGVDEKTSQPVTRELNGTKQMGLLEILTIARAAQESPDAEQI